MAEAIASEVMKLILEKPISQTYQAVLLAKDVESDTKRLQSSKAMFEAMLLDFKSSDLGSHSIQLVLNKFVREFAKIADFIDEKDARAKLKEVASTSKFNVFFSPSNQILTRFKDAQKIKSFRRELDFIAKEYAQYGPIINMLSTKQTRSYGVESGPRPMTEVVIGRDSERDDMIAMLCGSSNAHHESLSVVAIVGIGGQGKTTLAQYVYNDQRVEGYFDLRIWVFCTPHTTFKQVLEKIVALVRDEKQPHCEMAALQHWISRAIFGKKFLLVLDNMWEQENFRVDWLQLRALLKDGAHGSKVLVTSRSEMAAKVMDSQDLYTLCGLSENDSWLLLKYFALTKWHEQDLEAIGKDIAKLCQNVPLVLRSIGGLLAKKHTAHEWLIFRDELRTNSLLHKEDIVKTLKLSYDQLNEKLQLCVVYCSLFPKGATINPDQLICLWIALGYVVEVKNYSLEDVGKAYVKVLVDYGFFQITEEYGEIKLIMHDIMHDLILFIAQSQSSYQLIDFETNKIDEEVYHVSFEATTASSWDNPSSIFNIKPQLLQSMLIAPPLDIRIFGGFSLKFQSGYQSLISRNPHLKILDLRGQEIEQVPRCVAKLIQLRYLDLSNNDLIYKLSDSILGLVNLMFLNMSGCGNLQELPKDMRKLVKLRQLKLNECYSLQELPKGLWNLFSLELQGCWELKELPTDVRNLVKLRHLLVGGCQNLSHRPNGIGKLTELQTLDTFIVGTGEDKGKLAELRDLNSLKGSLTICVDEESKYVVSEAMLAHMERKDKLKEVTIEFKRSTKEDERVVEGLLACGVPNMKTLVIEGYGGEKLPSCMMNDDLYYRFPKLEHIYITYYREHSVLKCSFKAKAFLNPDKKIKVKINFMIVDKKDDFLEWVPKLSNFKVVDMELCEYQPSGLAQVCQQLLPHFLYNNSWFQNLHTMFG